MTQAEQHHPKQRPSSSLGRRRRTHRPEGADPARTDLSSLRLLGETEAHHIDSAPGKHTLQLVLGDAKHYPFNPPVVSKKITITVK